MDIAQAIAGYAALGVWYGILAIFGILGFVANHWVLLIVLGMIIAITLYVMWSNSERELASAISSDQSADAGDARMPLDERRHREKRPDWL